MKKPTLIAAVVATLILTAGCASRGSAPAASSPAPAPAVAAPVELPAPKKTVLVFDGDSSRAYEVLGEVNTTLKDQRIYNYEGSKDQAREHLKRVAYATYGERLDAVINYRSSATVGGGSFWGSIGAAYGARNTEIRATGVAVRFKGR